MFGIFKKKQPTAMDVVIRAIYGDHPPTKSADLERAVTADRDERVDAETVDGPNLPSSEWLAVAQALEDGSKVDDDQAARLRAAASAEGEERARAYRAVFISGEDKPRQRLFTKAIETNHPDLADRLRTEQRARSVRASQGGGLPRPHRGADRHLYPGHPPL